MFSIWQGLRTYKDRTDSEKSSMRLWSINNYKKISNINAPVSFKDLCIAYIVSSQEIYEFLINNYRDSFKGIDAEPALKEIVAYFIFDTAITCGDNFWNQIKLDSISDLVMEVGSIFDFETQTYNRIDSFIQNFKQNKERDIEKETQLLLFAIITETNAPIKEFPKQLEFYFKQKIIQTVLNFRSLLKEKNII